MGLIFKHILITLHSSNTKHYENLKYNIPKVKNKNGKIVIPKETKILVKIEDIPKNSKIKIDIKCDCCDRRLKPTIFKDYNKIIDKYGKYYCQKCATKLSKFNKSKTFEEWCIENNRQDILNLWDYDLNDKKPNEITYRMSISYYFKCSKGLHESELKNIYNITIGISNFRCTKCERKESILQKKVRLYLESLNIYSILHERNCTLKCINPKTKCQMPYDNEIKELKLIIEVHGIQHYTITNWTNLTAKHNNTTPEQELHYQKVKDRYKRMFAKSKINNYHYLEIPYYTDDKKETWKKLIDDKINEINNINT